MVVSDRARADLYARLRQVLGDNDAETMIELIPRGHPDDLATKGDIARLEERMDRFDERMDRFEEKMDRFDERLHDFHGALREQTRNFILASTGSMLTVGALAFAAASLV